MATGSRTVIETTSERRLIIEYDAAGRLVRIRSEPLTQGPTPDLPAVERKPFVKTTRSKPERPAAPLSPPVEPPRRAARAAPPPDEPEELAVTLEPYEDEPAPLAAPEPAAKPSPPAEAAPPPPPPPPPKRARFEVVAVEAVAPPRVEPVAAPPAEPPVEPVPPIVAAKPEPVVEASPEVAVETPPPPPPVVASEPEPAPPASYAALVPDVSTRVDALLKEGTQRQKAKKRAPLPVPAFTPLPREAWEDRLDKALSGRRS